MLWRDILPFYPSTNHVGKGTRRPSCRGAESQTWAQFKETGSAQRLGIFGFVDSKTDGKNATVLYGFSCDLKKKKGCRSSPY